MIRALTLAPAFLLPALIAACAGPEARYAAADAPREVVTASYADAIAEGMARVREERQRAQAASLGR